jgi:hypothetical protein
MTTSPALVAVLSVTQHRQAMNRRQVQAGLHSVIQEHLVWDGPVPIFTAPAPPAAPSCSPGSWI